MKELNEKQLKDVNGGTVAQVLQHAYKCLSCGNIFTPTSSKCSCDKCHSTNVTMVPLE